MNPTSNQYYGGLNRRFEKRCKLLKSLGFKYEITEFGGMLVKRNRVGKKVRCLAASLVMCAKNIDFHNHIRWS